MKTLNKVIKSIIISSLILVLVVPVVLAQAPTTPNKAIDAARAKFKEAQKERLQSINNFKGARSEFLKVKEEYRILKDKKLKELAKKKLEDRSKKFITNAIDALIRHLEAFKNKAQNSSKIPDSDKSAIISEIDKKIALLKDKLSGIDSMTPEQLVALAKEIRTETKSVRYISKKITGLLMIARINFVVDKLEKVSIILSNKISDLKSVGKDVSDLEKQLNNLNDLIKQAKDKLSAAKNKFLSITSIENVNKLFKEGMTLVRQADKLVKDAHKVLVKIINGIKKIVGEEQSGLEKLKGLRSEEKEKTSTSTGPTSTPSATSTQ